MTGTQVLTTCICSRTVLLHDLGQRTGHGKGRKGSGVWGLLNSDVPKTSWGSPVRSLQADWQAAHRLFVCVHGKWGGVTAATALGLSISVMGGGGVWYVSPPRLMDRKYNQRNNNICRIYIFRKTLGPYFSYGFNKSLSTSLNPDWWACLFKRRSLFGRGSRKPDLLCALRALQVPCIYTGKLQSWLS